MLRIFIATFVHLYTLNLVAECSGIVTLAPSIAEVVSELGLADQIVATSRYTKFPPELKNKQKVSTYNNLNIEELIKIHPTHLFALEGTVDLNRMPDDLVKKVTLLSHNRLAGLLDSVAVIKKLCPQADDRRLMQKFQNSLQKLESRAEKVLIVISSGDRHIRNMYLSGTDGIYHDLITLLGFQNVVKGKTKTMGPISQETIFKLNPDYVLEINAQKKDYRSQDVYQPWNTFSEMNFYKNKRVFLINQEYALIPGPRIILLYQKMKALLLGKSS